MFQEIQAARQQVTFAKAAGDRRRAQHQLSVATRANALGRQIERLLRAYGLQIFEAEKRKLLGGRLAIAKNLTRAQLERELGDVLRRFGLAQMSDAGKRAGGTGGTAAIPAELWRELQAAQGEKVKLIIEETEAMTRRSLQVLLTEALEERPRPTGAEVARRVARQWFGNPTNMNPGRGTQREAEAEGREALFGFTRAATIARTELAGAENAGIVAGLQAAGFVAVRWAAAANDGRSGARRHFLMREHAPVFLEAITAGDESGWFTLPDGTKTPRPMWEGLPAEHIVNCRCYLVGAA